MSLLGISFFLMLNTQVSYCIHWNFEELQYYFGEIYMRHVAVIEREESTLIQQEQNISWLCKCLFILVQKLSNLFIFMGKKRSIFIVLTANNTVFFTSNSDSYHRNACYSNKYCSVISIYGAKRLKTPSIKLLSSWMYSICIQYSQRKQYLLQCSSYSRFHHSLVNTTLSYPINWLIDKRLAVRLGTHITFLTMWALTWVYVLVAFRKVSIAIQDTKEIR